MACGLTGAGEWGMVWSMAQPTLAVAIQKPSGIESAGVRLTTVQLKREIHDSGICYVAIEMAKTGKRPIMVDGKAEWEDLSEAGHIDMIKFIVKKVLPDAKEYDAKEDRAQLDRWADIIAAEPVEG